ncbi:hypothetical protein C8R43DRAFT_344810 [Mycena crocata]|nr:hypothetical protein C8R43DRAFT_344810 [Mycena crocata]
MFAVFKIKSCAPAVLLANCVAAISIVIEASGPPTSGRQTTVVWTDADDKLPAFSMELLQPNLTDSIAIAYNCNPEDDEAQVLLPVVPAGGGYAIQFVNIANNSDVYGTSFEFSIDAPVSTSGTATGASATAPAPSGSGCMAPMSDMASMSIPSDNSASGSNAKSAASATASGAATGSRVLVFGGPVLTVSTVLSLVAAAAACVL